MRTIDEIKADIEYKKSIISEISKRKNVKEADLLPHVHQLSILENEFRDNITANIPLDRLEEMCKAERDGRLKISSQTADFYKCENCRHLSPSEITNRLFCTYHSECENWYETYKDDYCSDFERKEKTEVENNG